MNFSIYVFEASYGEEKQEIKIISNQASAAWVTASERGCRSRSFLTSLAVLRIEPLPTSFQKFYADQGM